MSCCIMPKSAIDFSQYENQLPTYDELKEYVIYTLNHIADGNYRDIETDKFSVQIWSDYLQKIIGKDMTDIELYSSVMSNIRIHLLPESKTIEATNLFEEAVVKTNYSLYWEGRSGKIEKGYSYVANIISSISFHQDEEIIYMLRQIFKSKQIECISDEEILKQSIVHVLKSMLWWKRDEYDLENRIKTFKNSNQFKADLGNYLKANNIDTNGGGAGPLQDTYRYSYNNEFSKPKLVIDMDKEYRSSLDREIDETLPPRYFQNDDRATVYHLEDSEFWKVAFVVLKGDPAKELNLFDFMQ